LPTFVFHQLRLRSAGDSQHNTWSHSNSNLHRNFASLKAVEKVFPVFARFLFSSSQQKKGEKENHQVENKQSENVACYEESSEEICSFVWEMN
jgi:hypothetical protein